jgi:hypothetical protein
VTKEQLVRELLGATFFYYPQHELAVERVWSQPGNPAALEALVRDPAAPPKARFLAAEVLFAKDVFFIDRVGRPLVARLYAEALAKRYTPHGNAWGLLWEDDGLGEAGGRFLVLGSEAIPALAELLDDDTVVADYEGSEEATLGNRARYRVKDFAAYYISRIRGEALPVHGDPAARDGEIARLERKLKP